MPRPNKVGLFLSLCAVTMVSGLLALTPRQGHAAPASSGETHGCTNSACSPGPLCNYDRDWNCFLDASGCQGNESCNIE